MAKPIKSDLKMNKTQIISLEELRSNATIGELLVYYHAERPSLMNFLITRGLNDLVEKINQIQSQNDEVILEQLCEILGIDKAITHSKSWNDNSENQPTSPETGTAESAFMHDNQSHTDEANRNQKHKHEQKLDKQTDQSSNHPKGQKMSARYNVVIVGQTGVGKSELINYLYGCTVAKSGVGRPVTKNGFHPIDLTINNLPVTIFDSWGIEVATYEQWIKELETELKGRGLDQSAENWFHSVYYCINAGSSRVQEADIAIIKKFQDSLYNVNVILTKADSISEEQITEFSNEIIKEAGNVKVIPVCSVARQGRGYTIQLFGKEDVEKQAYCDFYASLAKRLPERCEFITRKMIEGWASEQQSYVKESSNWQGWNTNEIESKIKSSLDKLISNIPNILGDEIKTTLLMYNQFCEFMNYPPASFSDLNKISFSKRSSNTSTDIFNPWDSIFAKAGKLALFSAFAIPAFIYFAATNSAGKGDEKKLIDGIEDSKEKLLAYLPKVKLGIASHLKSLEEKAAG